MAHKLAHGYYSWDESEDLEQVAAIGLLKAIDRFDPGRGLAFSTYAFPTILGELKRHFRDRGWAIRVPRALQELIGRVDRAAAELAGQEGRSPTVAEIAERTEATPERVLEALRARTARRTDSLDFERESENGGAPVGRELMVEDRAFARVEDAAMLDQFMRVLSPRDRLILSLRFREDLLQSQIGARVGLSQMQVSRSLRRSIDRLRQTAVQV
jgi:RNA polymerase sigma-B factor